jgi:hypothetical protein
MEVVTLIGVYLLFLAVGVFAGQTTMIVDVINPRDGIGFHASPVELVVRVTVRGAPVSDVRAKFTIRHEMDELSVEIVTDKDGVARLLVPAQSGNYTWQVTAVKEGYPTILSRSRSFSIQLSLVVYALFPSTVTLALSPVEFKARVTDTNGHLIESANVMFYVDSTMVGSSLTVANGVAKISSTVSSGTHYWFASATKDDEGGLSDPIQFVVG